MTRACLATILATLLGCTGASTGTMQGALTPSEDPGPELPEVTARPPAGTPAPPAYGW